MKNAATVRVLPPRTNQEVWDLIRRLDAAGPFSITDVERETNSHRKRIALYMRSICRHGFLVQEGTRGAAANRVEKLYRVAAAHIDDVIAPSAVEDGRGYGEHTQAAVWRAMRSLHQFTFTELAFAATTAAAINVETVSRYCRRLFAAGYLVETGKLGRNVVYRLKPAMNTGPIAPRMVRVDLAYDANKNEFFPKDALAEEAAA